MRILLVLVLLLFLIPLILPLIRGVIKMLDSAVAGGSKPAKPDVPLAGELKRDPICGTYVSSATEFTKVVAGQKQYFCSIECRDKA
jgi:hypothetical protein